MRVALVLCTALACHGALADVPGPGVGRALYIGTGVMRPQADPQLSEQDGHWSFVAGMTWRHSRHLAFEIDFMDTGQAAEMPAVERLSPGAPGSRQRAHINVDGVTGRLKIIFPAGRLEPFIGGGIGYYSAEVSSLGTLSHLVLPSDFAKRSDGRAGAQFLLGLDYILSSGSALGLEYRWLALDANFGPEFGGRTKVGGGIVLIGYRGALR